MRILLGKTPKEYVVLSIGPRSRRAAKKRNDSRRNCAAAQLS